MSSKSKWKLDPKSKPCLLFPSSKIVSSEQGELLLDETVLEDVITRCKNAYSISETTPVAIVSIVGSQSNEKYLLTKSLIQVYENEKEAGRKLGKLEELTPVLGPGIYLLKQPFMVHANGEDDDEPMLVFLLDIYPGKDKTSKRVEDQEVLERLLLLVSSLVVESKLENERYHLLKQLDELNTHKRDTRWLPHYKDPICDHFLFAYPSENIPHGLKSKVTPNAQAKLTLQNIIKRSSSTSSSPISTVDKRELEKIAWKIGNVNIIEMEKVKKPLYEETKCQDVKLEQVLVQSLSNSLKSIKAISELNPKVELYGTAINVEGLPTLIRNCVHSVNFLSGMSASAASTVEKSATPKFSGGGETIKSLPMTTFHPAAPLKKTSISSTSEINRFGFNNRNLVPTHQPNKSTVPLPPSSTAFDRQRHGSLKKPANTVTSSMNPSTGQEHSTGSLNPGRGGYLRNPTQETQPQERDLKLKRKQMHENYLKAQTYLQAQIPDGTKSWIKDRLSPSNIDKMIPTVNTHLINIFNERLLQNCLETTDTELWTELEEKVDRYCKGLCVAYLTEVQNRLKQFTSEVNQEFMKSKYFQPVELKSIGQQVFQIVAQGLQRDRHEIYILDIGCQKIMTYFTSHNEKIIGNEMTLANELLAKLINFYNEEMGRVTKGSIYSPTTLDRIHHRLLDNLCQGILRMFNFTEEGNSTLKNKLKILLANALQQHVEENTENLKRATTAISRCLDKFKSLYVKSIEKVLKDNPTGLNIKSLENQNKVIVQVTLEQLEYTIEQTVRQNEPVQGHVTSMKKYIDDYWKCVEDANNRNLKKSLEESEKKNGALKLKPAAKQRKVSQPNEKKPKEIIKATSKSLSFTSKSSSTSGSQNSNGGNWDQNELETARQELERQLKLITDEMNTNKKIVSQTGTTRKNFQKKVDIFFGVYNNPNSTLPEVQKQIRSLKIWLADLKG